MFRGPMQGGMMGAPQGMQGPQGMPGRGFGGQMAGTFGGGRNYDQFGDIRGAGMGGEIGIGAGRGHPGMRGDWGGMRGPQGMPPQWDAFPGGRGGWAGGGPEGMAGPIGSFPNMPPQFQGGPPAGGGFRQPGFISGGPDDPSRGGSGYWGGGRGIPGGMGGRPQAGPPVPRRMVRY